MRLTTERGELELPRGFSLTMERTNPFLSDEGDSSIPASLPASSHNLEVLEHRERIDRAYRYENKVDAILEVGPIQKHGQLVIDTVQRHDGIDASFAIDNSDLYLKCKDMTLTEIFSGWKGGIGMNIPFSDIESAAQYMISIYRGELTGTDFAVFPVAVSPYEVGEGDNKETRYNYNNEANGDSLVYIERVVREGDINMLVPKGYGLAPFLKLQRLLERLFQIMHYTVEYNCFDEEPFYSQIVIVHNCADCLCNPQTTLYYKDLVPSCTLSEFLEWLLAKFHVQPVVNSETKTVRIVKMEATLNLMTGVGGYDDDLSGLVEGDWKVRLNTSKRVVLTPTIEIEDTEPSAETFDKLIEKYGSFFDCNELQFQSLSSDLPAFSDCVIRRKSTGVFYLLERDLQSGRVRLDRLGTNYFTYDRNNSEETEEYSQADVMPLMLCGPKCETAPFIGKRIHRHTAYNGDTDDNEQKIIAVQAHTLRGRFAYATTGTTQNVIPYSNGVAYYEFWFGMDNYSLYPLFWNFYNRLLLNTPVHLTGQVKLGVEQLLNMDMSMLKLCDSQRLLPVKASARIGEKIDLTEAEFIRAELFLDGISDKEIQPSTGGGYKWEMTTDADAVAQRLWQQVENNYVGPIMYNVEYADIVYDGYDIAYGSLNPGVPHQGETKTIQVMATIIIHVHEVITYNDNSSPQYSYWDETFHNQTVTVTLTAVPA